MTTRHPPVIPEIAKAYQNDPKTALALAALKAGSSTAPVAVGKYGYADGIARALQGVVGGMTQRDQADTYGADQDKLLALRQQRGVDGLNGVAVPTPGAIPATTPMPPQVPAASAAPAIASALGAPPPAPAAPQGPPGMPTAPMPPQGPPQGASAPPPGGDQIGDLLAAAQQGGGPGGQRPFGPPASAPAFLAQPTDAPVPNAPAPVARPVRPNAIGPTKSPMLNAAYRLMSDANPYESAQGQDMYQEGLGEQGKFNEAATARQQSIIDAEYATDRGMYADAANQDRGAALKGREDVIARNAAAQSKYGQNVFDYGVHKEDQTFQAGEKAKDRANAVALESMKEANDQKIDANKSTGGGQWGLTPDEMAALNKAAGEGRVDVTRLNSRTAKIQAGIFMANPGFDAMTNHGAAALIGNATAQQKAQMAAMLPDVLDNVRKAGQKVNFSDAKFVGNLQAFSKGQFNDPDFTAYMTQRNDAMQTLAQVMRGTGATDKATQMEADAAPKTLSPKAWDAWYGAQLKALTPRISIMERNRLLPAGTANSITSRLGDSGTTAPASGGWGKATVVN